MRTIVVVDNLEDWSLKDVEAEVVTAKSYLTQLRYDGQEPLKVLNLCRSYGYQRLGYYVSLVATARDHRPQPSLLCIEDLKSNSMIRSVSKDMDELIAKSLRDLKDSSFVLSIYFGQSVTKKYNRLALYLCKQFPAPFLQARFNRVKDKWILTNIYPMALDKIPEHHLEHAQEQVVSYFKRGGHLQRSTKKSYRYEMAILVNPEDPTPPSDKKALQQFVKASEAIGLRAEIIEPSDFGRIPEFDALFIRETTQVNHHTFKFARRAAAHGLVVVDDHHSILRCANKIFQAELMQKYHLPAPQTEILAVKDLKLIAKNRQYPLVLKQPDGSFSRGVVLVNSPQELIDRGRELGKTSDLIVAQQFMPSEFDWRIGVLGGCPLYACQYFMVRDHWQIYRNRESSKKVEEGDSRAVPLSEVPPEALHLASKVSKLIGNGLYGIDIKELNGRFYIIEVNDNPSIEVGCEDELLGSRLYQDIANWFLTRLEARGDVRRE